MSLDYRCNDCGRTSVKWFGRCPECGGWSTAADPVGDGGAQKAVATLDATLAASITRWSSGISELDRVLGGGFVPGAALLLAGEPGIGKSTLILQALDAAARSGRSTLLCTGEESLAQVAGRASRLGLDGRALRALATDRAGSIVAAALVEQPDLLVVDSIQTIASDYAEQAPGSVVQVRACAAELIGFAKSTGTVVVLVGHVTKEGTVAGPKTLEHMVDAVLTLEGDRSGMVRLLRSSKNRFGPCDETGVFTMSPLGLECVDDPSEMFLADRRPGSPGSVVLPSLEGSRPMLVEIQAMICKSDLAQPRRVTIGLDPRRAVLVAGTMAQRCSLDIERRDVFLAASGGIAVREPAADLAIALALRSAALNEPIHPGLVAAGEIGLGGEVRRVPGIERRLSEAARLGFTRAVAPRDACPRPGIEVMNAVDVAGAIAGIDQAATSGASCYP